MSNKKDKIKISFVGENSHEVTGSCVWIKTPHRQILLECGLWQSAGDALDIYNKNNAHFQFKAKDIDYVFVGHTHVDHCGKLPLLYKRGCDAHIFMPKGSKRITDILLRDSANIAQSDAAELSKKYKRNYEPLYDMGDVDATMECLYEYPMNEMVYLDEYVRFRFVPSGHILNSAQIELWITEGNITKKIAYTSDLGNVHVKKYFTNKLSPITKADVVISECTYCGEDRIATQKIRDKDVEKLQTVITNTCVEKRGKVLIPVFANSRGQEILMTLYDIFGDDPNFKVPILFDTPMGVEICHAYSRLLSGADAEKWTRAINWENVKFIVDPIDSKTWQQKNTPAVVLSSSGMMTRGRSRSWCKQLMPFKNNTIIFCGFAVDNSLAAIMKMGRVKAIKFNGKMVSNRCQIIDLHSFSSHIQKDSLLSMLSKIECEKILLVHGDSKNKKAFAEELETAISKENKTSKVVCVDKDYVLNL